VGGATVALAESVGPNIFHMQIQSSEVRGIEIQQIIATKQSEMGCNSNSNRSSKAFTFGK
jgi:hypothetical protein